MNHGDVSRADFLAEVTRLVADDLAPWSAGHLAASARPLALAPVAKRARPALLFELGRLAGAPAEALVGPAAMIELMHTASLVHDDIIDGAATRRGTPSVNAALGNATAVLVGDDVIVRAFLRVAEAPALLKHGLHALAAMVHAVASEVAARGDVALDEAAWTAIAGGKTAALFALCGRFAGLIAGDAAAAERLAAAAHHLGLAFQAADDVADLLDGSDLVERNPSLCVVHAVAASPAVALRLATAWARGRLEPAEVDGLREAIVATGAVAGCRALIDANLAAADALLAPLANAPDRVAALTAIRGWAAALAGTLPGTLPGPGDHRDVPPAGAHAA